MKGSGDTQEPVSFCDASFDPEHLVLCFDSHRPLNTFAAAPDENGQVILGLFNTLQEERDAWRMGGQR